MALDLSDPPLRAAYEDLLRPDGQTDWCVLLLISEHGAPAADPTSATPCRLVLGYGASTTQLLLVDRGTRGLEELRNRLVRPLEDSAWATHRLTSSTCRLPT